MGEYYDHRLIIPVSKLTPVSLDDMQGACSEGLYTYAKALSKSVRGLEFYNSATFGVVVATQGNTFASGILRYGPLTNTGSADYYGIRNGAIENNKYADYSDQYRMFMSTDITRAVRNAKRWLRPPTHGQVAKFVFNKAVDELTDHNHKEAWEVDKLLNKLYIRDRSTLAHVHKLVELVDESRLAALGISDVQEFVADIKRAYSQYIHSLAERNDRDRPMVYVHAKEQYNGEHVFTVVQNPELESHLRLVYTYREDELPEDIAEQIAVLSIGEDDTYFDGVGYRYIDNVHIVFRKEITNE